MIAELGRKRGRPAKNREIVAEKLLRQAFQMFAQQGFEATSLRKLAADAGIDYTLYRQHFGDKNELWRAAVTVELSPLMTELMRLLHPAQDAADPLEALRQNIGAALRMAAEDPARASVLLRETGSAQRRRWLYTTFLAPYLTQVDAAFRLAQAQQLIRPIPLESLHAMISGVIRALADPGIMEPRMRPLLQDTEKRRAYVEGAISTLFMGIQI